VAPGVEVEFPLAHVRTAQLLVVGAGLVDLPRLDGDLDAGPLETAHAGADHLAGEGEPQCVAARRARNLQPRRHQRRRELVLVTAERDLARLELELEPLAIPRRWRDPRQLNGCISRHPDRNRD
jgi:hypothetical protein